LRFSGRFLFYVAWTSTTSRDSLSFLNLFLSFGLVTSGHPSAKLSSPWLKPLVKPLP